MTEPKAYEEGAMARVVKTDPEWPYCNEGRMVIIDDIYPDDETEDGVGFCTITTADGMASGFEIPTSNLEVTMTAAEVQARKIPDMKVILDFLGSQLLNSGDGFRISETEDDMITGTIEAFGVTDDGLRFGFDVNITNIYEVDF